MTTPDSTEDLRPPVDSATVIIAAFNEEAVIADCLQALLAQDTAQHLQIIVSANGCTDGTAEVAARYGVQVIDRQEPGKTGALNAAEAAAEHFPRIYLDADIALPAHAIESVVSGLSQAPGALAIVPRRRIDTSGRPALVRAYYAINERLPVFTRGLFGRGMITLSEQGRSRFAEFPAMIADDLFLDSLFSASEKAVATDVEIVVAAPYSTRDLIARLVRVRRGNAELRGAASAGELHVAVRPSDKWAWLREVVIPEPRLALAAIPYVAITMVAGVLARRRGSQSWGRDDSTRRIDINRGPE